MSNDLKKIRILILTRSEHRRARKGSVEKICNIVSGLRQFVKVEDVWLTLESGIGDTIKGLDDYHSSEINFKEINDYNANNALSILQKEKPDVILLTAEYEFRNRAFVIAAKFLRIPVVSHYMGFPITREAQSLTSSLLKNMRILVARGFFILKKYLFLFRTYVAIRLRLSEMIKAMLMDVVSPFVEYLPSSKYGADRVLVCNLGYRDFFLNKGVDSGKIFVIGDPQFDTVFRKVNETIPIKKESNEKTNVLFITTSMVEHGLWSRQMRDYVVSSVISEINEKLSDTVNLSLKIHPVSESLEEYEKIVYRINRDIPIYKGQELIDLIKKSDVIITFGNSWAILEALLARKPVIVINFFNESSKTIPYLEEGVTYEARVLGSLITLLQTIKYKHMLDEEKIKTFISKYLYKVDGQASLRAARCILQAVRNASNISRDRHDA